MRFVSSRHAVLAGFASIMIGSTSVAAQSGDGGRAPVMTRAQLTERARAADSLGRHEEAFLLRNRLREGDFAVGDVVIAQYEGPLFLPTGVKRDSLVVQAGKILFLGPPMGDLPLAGILRYELEDTVRARFNRYYREHSVRVTALIRLSISGAAKNPGFYQFRTDVPLSDVVMRGGGQSTVTGTIDEITIKRGDKVIWGAVDVQSALTSGMTVSDLDLQAGDDIVVTQASTTSGWKAVLPYTATLLGLAAIFIRRR